MKNIDGDRIYQDGFPTELAAVEWLNGVYPLERKNDYNIVRYREQSIQTSTGDTYLFSKYSKEFQQISAEKKNLSYAEIDTIILQKFLSDTNFSAKDFSPNYPPEHKRRELANMLDEFSPQGVLISGYGTKILERAERELNNKRIAARKMSLQREESHCREPEGSVQIVGVWLSDNEDERMRYLEEQEKKQRGIDYSMRPFMSQESVGRLERPRCFDNLMDAEAFAVRLSEQQMANTTVPFLVTVDYSDGFQVSFPGKANLFETIKDRPLAEKLNQTLEKNPGLAKKYKVNIDEEKKTFNASVDALKEKVGKSWIVMDVNVYNKMSMGLSIRIQDTAALIYADAFYQALRNPENYQGDRPGAYHLKSIDCEAAITLFQKGYLEDDVRKIIEANSPSAKIMPEDYTDQIIEAAMEKIKPFLLVESSRHKVMPHPQIRIDFQSDNGPTPLEYAEYLRIRKARNERALPYDIWRRNASALAGSENAFPSNDLAIAGRDAKGNACFNVHELSFRDYTVSTEMPIRVHDIDAGKDIPIEFRSLKEGLEYAHGVFSEKNIQEYRVCRGREQAILESTIKKPHKPEEVYLKSFHELQEKCEKSYIDIDTKIAASLLTKGSNHAKIAALIQRMSPQAVLSEDYGQQIVLRAKIPVFIKEAKAIQRKNAQAR